MGQKLIIFCPNTKRCNEWIYVKRSIQNLFTIPRLTIKSKEADITIMFTRVYMTFILDEITQNKSKLLQLFQTNEDFRQLFQGIYQYLVSEELEL